jgi:hypothetical protein
MPYKDMDMSPPLWKIGEARVGGGERKRRREWEERSREVVVYNAIQGLSRYLSLARLAPRKIMAARKYRSQRSAGFQTKSRTAVGTSTELL